MMHIILLAAGRGTRLGTQDLPKTLVTVGDKPLGQRILTSLKSFCPKQVTVVGGFQYETLVAGLSQNDLLPINVLTFIKNSNFQAGNLLTLLCAKNDGTDSFAVMNADHLYSSKILKKIFSWDQKNMTVVCDFDRPLGDDDMKIQKTQSGHLKVMKKRLESYEGGYIGVTLVPQNKLSDYWKACDQVLKNAGDAVCVEEVINYLVNEGSQVDIMDASGSTWIEVDTADDLVHAQIKILEMIY